MLEHHPGSFPVRAVGPNADHAGSPARDPDPDTIIIQCGGTVDPMGRPFRYSEPNPCPAERTNAWFIRGDHCGVQIRNHKTREPAKGCHGPTPVATWLLRTRHPPPRRRIRAHRAIHRGKSIELALTYDFLRRRIASICRGRGRRSWSTTRARADRRPGTLACTKASS